jgi:hypothetical protein
MTLPCTLAIDISTFQDSPLTPTTHIDFTKPHFYNIHLIINRATFSIYPDDDFPYNWQQEKLQHYIRSAYGFYDYRPGNPGVAAQAYALVSALIKDPGEFPVVWMDIERPIATWPLLPKPRVILAAMKQYALIVESGLPGKTCGWYMNPGMIKYLMSDWFAWQQYKAFILARPLWVAAWPDWLNPKNTGIYKALPGETLEQWINRLNWKPNLYNQWVKWLIWQYGTPTYGIKYGMDGSKEIDCDFYNGNYEELLAFCKLVKTDDDVIIPDPVVIYPQMKVCALWGLKIRSTPDNISNANYLYSKTYLSKVTIYETVDNLYGKWVRIDPDKQEWCCVANNSGVYLKNV